MKQRKLPEVGTMVARNGKTRTVTESPAEFGTIRFTEQAHRKERYPGWCYINDWFNWLGQKRVAWSPK